MDCNLSGYSDLGIFQARMLEWVTISFYRGSSWPRDQTQVSCIADRCFTIWATGEAQYSWENLLQKLALQEILKKIPIPHMFLPQISTPLSLSIFSNVTFTVRPCLKNPVKITISNLWHFLCPFLTAFNHISWSPSCILYVWRLCSQSEYAHHADKHFVFCFFFTSLLHSLSSQEGELQKNSFVNLYILSIHG